MTTVDARAEYKMHIGGEWVTPTGGTYQIVNPATEEVVGEAPEATVEDVAAAAAAAKKAFESWSRTSRKERSALIRAAADRWVEKQEELVPLVQAETGAIIGVAAGAQVPGCSNRLYEYADLALEDWDVPLPPSCVGGCPSWRRAPCSGRSPSASRSASAACITPYNFPLTSVAGKIGPALAMGNTVIIKPAPQDPLGIIEMVKVFEEVGFPPGVINVVTGLPARGGRGPRRFARRRHDQLHRLERGRLQDLRGRRQDDEAPAAWSWAARAPPWSCATPTSRRPSGASPASGHSTPGRSAPPPPGWWSTARSTRSWSTDWPRRPGPSRPATRSTRPRWSAR